MLERVKRLYRELNEARRAEEMSPKPALRVVLIGGTSHAGKTALAGALAARLGWIRLSTDSLARHPGRPWKTGSREVPDGVAKHYLSLPVDELIEDVLSHYRNLWPRIRDKVMAHATDPALDRLILEGSALWPDSVATLALANVEGLWLTASDELLRKRIHGASRFEEAPSREREMIQKFTDRTIIYNSRMMKAIGRHGLRCIKTEEVDSPEDLSIRCLELLPKLGGKAMHGSDLKIRTSGPEDAEVITKIYVDSWNAGFGARMPVIEADPSRIGRWRRDLGDTTPTRWWVAERKGLVVGFVGIGPCRDPIQPGLGELDTIAVTPSEWHSGIGKALMSVALEGLRTAGYRSAALWTLSRYPLGESFYVSTGWLCSGQTRGGGDQVRYDHDLKIRGA